METPRRNDRRKLSRVSCQKLKSATVKENVLPSTQAFQPTCTSSSLKEGGEVYWDSNSPSLKTKILRHYSECSSPDVRKSLSPQIVSTPSARVCTQESPKIDEQDLSLLQSLKALNDFDKDTDSNTEDNEESKESNENTFNSDEDSFLVLASQIPTSETSRSQNSLGKTKTQSNSLKPPSLPRLPPPAFDEDDDDEMDLLLSQIEMPKEVEEETKVLNIKSVRRHEQVTAAAAAGQIEEKFLKRRFKSSEQGPKSSSSANIMKGWRRSNTEPETRSGSALPGGRILPPAKCTQEDIEKKRQEALRRRKEKLRSY